MLKQITPCTFEYLKREARYAFRGTSSLDFERMKLGCKHQFNGNFYCGHFNQNKPITSVCFDPVWAASYARYRTRKRNQDIKNKPLFLIIRIEDYKEEMHLGLEPFEAEIRLPIRLSDIIIADDRKLKNIEKYSLFDENGFPLGITASMKEQGIEKAVQEQVEIIKYFMKKK